MIAPRVWQRMRVRRRSVTKTRDDGLRRVAVRLAAQTVGLLLVMLIALEVAVYLITQQTLLASLETTLTERAVISPDFASQVFGVPNHGNPFSGPGPRPGQPQPGQGNNPGGPGRPGGPGSNPDLYPSEASAAFVSKDLHLLHADGALGARFLAPTDVLQAVRTGRTQCCTVHSYKGQDYLVYTSPVSSQGKFVGAVQTSISEHEFEQTMQSLLQALLVVAVLGLLVSGGISAVLVRRALTPIRAAVQRQRDFVADAAHELRTPLAIMRTVGEVGLAAPSVDELQSTVAQMLGENQHLTRLVEDLSILARTDTNTVSIDKRPVDLSSLVTSTAEELSSVAEEQGVGLGADVDGQVRIIGDVVRLRQLLLILLDNALKHTPAGGKINIRLAQNGGRARLEVADSGPGIDPKDLPRLFDRFYRSDQARTGEGSGLGLSIGKWIVEAHSGQIHAGNGEERGAVFTVTLPVARGASTA
jgi:signal transduction histidine kinase